MALADGDLTSAQFDSGRWRDPDIKTLMATMLCVPSAELEERFPKGRPARLSAQMKDGARHAILVEAPLGDASRPMDDGQIRSKFLAQAIPILGTDRAAQAADTIMMLENVDNIGLLSALLIARA
jgi:2-methylcitrate dehydratase PrpD